MSDTEQSQSTVMQGHLTGFNLFLVYDNATGEILKYGMARDFYEDGGASMAAQAGPGQTALAIAQYPDAATMHVVDGQVRIR